MMEPAMGPDGKLYKAHLAEPKSRLSMLAVPGDLAWYPSNGIPRGWLICDNTLHNPDAYPALFAAIGYRHGRSGRNFRVPNPGNVFLRPWATNSNQSTMFGTRGASLRGHSHNASGTLGQAGAHTHSIRYRQWLPRTITGTYINEGDVYSTSIGSAAIVIRPVPDHVHSINTAGGGAGTGQTEPEHVVLALCICAVGLPMAYTGT